jgi:hypothetical protein
MARPHGSKFRLVIYDRLIGRYRWPTFLLTAALLGPWFAKQQGLIDWPAPQHEAFILSGGLVALACALFVWVGPVTSYVQPRKDHLRLQTPIYRVVISYRRVLGTRPVDLTKLYPPSSLRPSQRRLIQPLFGRTAIVVDVQDLPVPKLVMRLFLNRFFFPPDHIGLVLLVDKWSELSQQLSTRIDSYRAGRQARFDERLATAIVNPSRNPKEKGK